MSPLGKFIAYFLAISAVMAFVNCLVREDRPGPALRHSAHFFLLIVLGILGLSAVVYGIEWVFGLRP